METVNRAHLYAITVFTVYATVKNYEGHGVTSYVSVAMYSKPVGGDNVAHVAPRLFVQRTILDVALV